MMEAVCFLWKVGTQSKYYTVQQPRRSSMNITIFPHSENSLDTLKTGIKNHVSLWPPVDHQVSWKQLFRWKFIVWTQTDGMACIFSELEKQLQVILLHSKNQATFYNHVRSSVTEVVQLNWLRLVGSWASSRVYSKWKVKMGYLLKRTSQNGNKLLMQHMYSYTSKKLQMMLLFWVLLPSRLVGRCQRFGKTCCLHLQGWSGDARKWRDLYTVIGREDRRSGPIRFEEWGVKKVPSTSQHCPEDGDSMFFRNVGIYRRVYKALKPRRIISSSKPPWKPEISRDLTEFLGCSVLILWS
jgi:hypothetical protein